MPPQIGEIRTDTKNSEALVCVQILDLEIDDSKTVKAKFRLGIDPGYKHIGFCLIKETVNECKILLSGEYILRTAAVTNVSTEFEVKQYFQSFRRHNTRAASIRIEDKKYGIVVGKYANDKFKALAWNTRARTGQAKTKPSLELFKRKNPSTQLRLIKPGRVVYRRALTGHEIKFTPGDLAYSQSEDAVFTIQGWAKGEILL